MNKEELNDIENECGSWMIKKGRNREEKIKISKEREMNK